MAHQEQQIASLEWHHLRRQYREENHRRVVEREGLRPDKHTGDIKGPPLMSAMKEWNGGEFEVIRGSGLDQELLDLARDAQLFDIASAVKHEIPDDAIGRTFTPVIAGNLELMNDEEIDKELQKIVLRDY